VCCFGISFFCDATEESYRPQPRGRRRDVCLDVGDVNLVLIDGIENKITKTRRNDNANVRFVRFSSRERMVTELTRALDKELSGNKVVN
jgi:hypothetical protein